MVTACSCTNRKLHHDVSIRLNLIWTYITDNSRSVRNKTHTLKRQWLLGWQQTGSNSANTVQEHQTRKKDRPVKAPVGQNTVTVQEHQRKKDRPVTELAGQNTVTVQEHQTRKKDRPVTDLAGQNTVTVQEHQTRKKDRPVTSRTKHSHSARTSN